MTKTVFVLNGPNLNLLGVREPEIYGTTTLDDVEAMCRERAGDLGVGIDFRQTNSETAMVEWIQEAYVSKAAGIVINPAGHSFHSIPVLDALRIFRWPIVELHISNIHARDTLHQHSIMSSVATAVIAGMGVHGYILALDGMAALIHHGQTST
tara:strand:- start:645 stop:1103 length:459 start_codon:yes stop_codon:yes gene_type:complete